MQSVNKVSLHSDGTSFSHQRKGLHPGHQSMRPLFCFCSPTHRSIYRQSLKSFNPTYRTVSAFSSPEQPTPSPSGSGPDPSPGDRGPELIDGVNWYCTSVLGLLFITDFTPIGLLLQGSLTGLAIFQWSIFVLPTLLYMRERGWNVRQTLRLFACPPGWLAAGAAAGVATWLAVRLAISIKTGTLLPWELLHASNSAAATSDSPVVLLGGVPVPAADGRQWATLFVAAALSPAVAEELLYRGLLLSALQRGLGQADSVLLSAALFAATHLSVEQFFPLTVLGAAAGTAALASGSVAPAIALHLGYNASGLAAGVLASAAAAAAM